MFSIVIYYYTVLSLFRYLSFPRYAPQPKLFPDYEEEWGEGAEDLLRQSLREEQPTERGKEKTHEQWRLELLFLKR